MRPDAAAAAPCGVEARHKVDALQAVRVRHPQAGTVASTASRRPEEPTGDLVAGTPKTGRPRLSRVFPFRCSPRSRFAWVMERAPYEGAGRWRAEARAAVIGTMRPRPPLRVPTVVFQTAWIHWGVPKEDAKHCPWRGRDGSSAPGRRVNDVRTAPTTSFGETLMTTRRVENRRACSADAEEWIRRARMHCRAGCAAAEVAGRQVAAPEPAGRATTRFRIWRLMHASAEERRCLRSCKTPRLRRPTGGRRLRSLARTPARTVLDRTLRNITDIARRP
jgi:hypothetical protein